MGYNLKIDDTLTYCAWGIKNFIDYNLIQCKLNRYTSVRHNSVTYSKMHFSRRSLRCYDRSHTSNLSLWITVVFHSCLSV